MGRKKALFEKNAVEPFMLSRNKLENFLKCPRCFYLDRRLGFSPPSMPPFTLNNAVDHLMKNEFDGYRANKEAHPIMKQAGLNAVPLENKLLEGWQDYHHGLQYHMKDINITVMGAPDDVWQSDKGEYIVVDYKATSSDKEINLDDDWKKAYKHQIEIYQWLFRQNGYNVSDTAYFVYTNALKTRKSFGDKLTFKTVLLPYVGSTEWVEGAIRDAYNCLCQDAVPGASEKCELCRYVESVKNFGVKK